MPDPDSGLYTIYTFLKSSVPCRRLTTQEHLLGIQFVNAILIVCTKEMADKSLEKENSKADGNMVDLRANRHGFEFYFALCSCMTTGGLYNYPKTIM